MPQQIKRLIVAFAFFILLFLVLRQVLKPSSFGDLGHYRADAIQENIDSELHYAGIDNCSKCHEDIHMDKAIGFHANLNCEVCHGPGMKHVLYAGNFTDRQLPDSLLLYKPVGRSDCAVCHQVNAARIKILFDTIDNSMIRQIDAMTHNPVNKRTNEKLNCIDCHNPHQP
ncbi:MAG: hypothetical protein K0B15_13440 [Lentimicrobium sp.]|nr:hypothetical protein [Lentimicrobium sp.]